MESLLVSALELGEGKELLLRYGLHNCHLLYKNKNGFSEIGRLVYSQERFIDRSSKRILYH